MTLEKRCVSPFPAEVSADPVAQALLGEPGAAASESRALVPVGAKPLGEWGETRLANFLDGQGLKPNKPFITPLGPRYPDRLLNGVSYESKAGLNVGLTPSMEGQIAKDAYLIENNVVKGVEWHFWRGAKPELVEALQKNGIKVVIH